MKILITGGAGFIGTNFTKYYFETHPEDQIVILDKLTYAGNLDNIASFLENDRVNFVNGDVADKNLVDDLFEIEKFDYVVNFAAETHVDRSIDGPEVFVKTNIVGTHTLIEASKKYNVKRYHQVSTDEVYGDLGLGTTELFTENSQIKPNCPYAAAKASADLLVHSYFETYSCPNTISRCSNNYGPYQFPEKLIPYFFRLASQDKALPVYGDGLNVRDWLYVIDHCRAIDMILHNGVPGEVYNIGGNNEKTNLEITSFILKFLGKDETLITYVNDRLAHDRRYAIDSSKIQKELSWSPTVDFNSGLDLTFNWYKNNTAWIDSIISKLEERKHKQISMKPLEAVRK